MKDEPFEDKRSLQTTAINNHNMTFWHPYRNLKYKKKQKTGSVELTSTTPSVSLCNKLCCSVQVGAKTRAHLILIDHSVYDRITFCFHLWAAAFCNMLWVRPPAVPNTLTCSKTHKQTWFIENYFHSIAVTQTFLIVLCEQHDGAKAHHDSRVCERGSLTWLMSLCSWPSVCSRTPATVPRVQQHFLKHKLSCETNSVTSTAEALLLFILAQHKACGYELH